MQQAQSEAVTDKYSPGQSGFPTAEQLRFNAYSLMANLLYRPADESLLSLLAELPDPSDIADDMTMSWQLLKLAARQNSLRQVDDEFHALFVGLGHGEVIPYGSWYQTGYLMDKPLAKLRRDLIALGIERSSEVKEPEDHIAALCETMALLIANQAPQTQQRTFYHDHIANWAPRLFLDIERAPSACFYQAVSHFGKHYFELEAKYLA
jgi:TorA maturation chaperone TorD